MEAPLPQRGNMLKKQTWGNADLENTQLGDLCRNFLPQMVLTFTFHYQAEIACNKDVTVDTSVVPEGRIPGPQSRAFPQSSVHCTRLFNSTEFTDIVEVIWVIACVPFLSTPRPPPDYGSLAAPTIPGTYLPVIWNKWKIIKKVIFEQ